MNYFAVGLAVFFCLGKAVAAVYDYPGNGDTTGGGAVGNGSLRLNSSGSTVTVTLTRGLTGNFNDVLVLFIDSKSGGFTSTATFSDTQSGLRKAVSGFSAAGRATATFAPGFAADYAVAIGVNGGAFVFELASGSSFADAQFLRGPFDNANSATYSATFDWSYIGLGDPGATKSFTFESSYITETGSRYLESFESLSGTKGFNSVTFGNYDSFPPAAVPVPETTNLAMAIFGGIFVVIGVLRGRRMMLEERV